MAYKIKHLLFFLLLLSNVSLFGTYSHAQAMTANGFKLYKGINISHWLSQCFDAIPSRNIFFSEMDVVFLKNAGFDHIRLPIDEKELWDEAGHRNEDAFFFLHQAIQWCQRHGLKIIVDLHTVRSHHFNADFDGLENTLFTSELAQEKFLSLWTDLSQALKDYPNDLLAYELLNEAIADDHENWNKLLAKGIACIRTHEPKRSLIIGSNKWQQAQNFKYLKVPEGDPNLILSFHTYSPFLLTHYKAPWVTTGKYEGPVTYPGVIVDEAYILEHYDQNFLDTMVEYDFKKEWTPLAIEEEITEALKVAQEKGLSLYCGEWGCLPTCGRENRLRYYQDVVNILDKHQIARANWDYKGDFSIIDRDTMAIDWELIHILTD